MGLLVSHGAFEGAYSSFQRLRKVICASIGGSFPYHLIEGTSEINHDLDPDQWYWGKGRGYSKKSHPGLYEFFCHSDCEGEISPAMCTKLANELEAILPLIEKKAQTEPEAGHILRDGGYVNITKRFIIGCRLAAESNEPLIFS